MKQFSIFIIAAVIIISCKKNSENHSSFDKSFKTAFSYKSIFESVKPKTKTIELKSSDGKARVLVTPELNGKILTSSFNGLSGNSNGWVDFETLNKDTLNAESIGGEERIWLGPLGGQYSFYYQQIEPLDENNWSVPFEIGKKAFKVLDFDESQVSLQKDITITNFIGTTFNLELLRNIKLLKSSEIKKNLSTDFTNDINFVAYETSHYLINKGAETWSKNNGLVSLWSAGMFEGGNNTTVIIPLLEASSLKAIYQYMGTLDSSRIKIIQDRVLLFKADGKYRSKIGIPKHLAPSIYACYAKDKNLLTIVQYRQTNDTLYSNSDVSIQKSPYKGEVIPIYNNGTMDYSPTNQTSFFELESTSTMKALKPLDTLKHWHRVYHFSGTEKQLNDISKEILSINLSDCKL